MTFRRGATLLVLAALIVATCLIMAFRESGPVAAPEHALRKTEPPVGAAKVSSVPQSSRLTPASAPILETRPLATLLPDPMVDPVRKWRALNGLGNPLIAQMQAVNSGDPVLVHGAVHAMLHCMATAVQLHGKDVRQYMTEHSRDPKTGLPMPPNEVHVQLNETLSKVGPQRLVPIPELRAEFTRAWSNFEAGEAQGSTARTMDIFVRNAAPLNAGERAAYDAVVAQSATDCAGRVFSPEFGAAWRTANDQLVARGVTSALLFNSRAGWLTPRNSRDLEPRDFDLLEKAFLDAQPDTWARLLLQSPRATGQPRGDLWPDDVAMLGAYMSLDALLGPLTACALGVYECGRNSTYFRSICMDHGGCDQADLAALIRHVFQRDGLDPGIVDREIERVVNIYRNRDFTALGFRRR